MKLRFRETLRQSVACLLSLLKKSYTPIIALLVFSMGVQVYIINNSFIWGYDPFNYLGLAKLMIHGQDSSWAFPRGTQSTFIDRLPFAGLVFLSVFLEEVFSVPSIMISRYVMAMMGTISVVIVYLLVKRTINGSAALVTGIFLSVSPWYLAHSTTLYPDVFFFLMSVTCLYFFISKKNLAFLSYYHMGLIFYILSLATRPYAFLLLPSILLSLLIEQDRRRALRIIIYVLMTTAMIFSVVVYRAFLISGDPLAINLLYTRFSVIEQISMFNATLLYKAFFEQLANQVTPVIFVSGLLGMIISLFSRKKRLVALPLILYIFIYLFYTNLFYSPYTQLTTIDPNQQSILTELPPRVLIPINGFVVIFAGIFWVSFSDFLVNASVEVMYQSKRIIIAAIRHNWIKKVLIVLIVILIPYGMVYPSFLKAESLVYSYNTYEERYLCLASWINSNVSKDELVLTSYSWRVWYLIKPDLRNQIIDIANTPSNETDFLHYLIQNKTIHYVVYDPQWTASKIRFDPMPKSLKEEIFEAVFSYTKVGPPLIVYKNLLINHNPVSFSSWNFDKESIWHLASYSTELGSLRWGIAEGLGRNNTRGLFINHTGGNVNAYIEQREWVTYSSEYNKGPYKLEPVFPQTNYMISFWAKAHNFQGNISARPVFFDLSGKYLYDFDWQKHSISVTGDFDWTKYSFTFEIPRQAFLVLIRIQIDKITSGLLTLDDVTFEYVHP